MVIPKQKYAVQRHIGPNDNIRKSYERLHRWIESNKLERIRRAWHLEITEEWGHAATNDIVTDLYDTIK